MFKNFYKKNKKGYSGFWIFKKYLGVSNMSKKVYCSRCKSIGEVKGFFKNISTIDCYNDGNKKTIVENTNLDWYEEPKSHDILERKPADINKSNNCPWFEAKEVDKK